MAKKVILTDETHYKLKVYTVTNKHRNMNNAIDKLLDKEETQWHGKDTDE